PMRLCASRCWCGGAGGGRLFPGCGGGGTRGPLGSFGKFPPKPQRGDSQGGGGPGAPPGGSFGRGAGRGAPQGEHAAAVAEWVGNFSMARLSATGSVASYSPASM